MQNSFDEIKKTENDKFSIFDQNSQSGENFFAKEDNDFEDQTQPSNECKVKRSSFRYFSKKKRKKNI